ncbi:MAG TPA: glycosyltransferase, partial [Mycobacteriales bacterium]|nr:glycosyltransferase [Mycobacteriales bacterium]
PADRIHVIGAGVDTAAFPPSPLPAGPPVVSYVGRLVPKKGLDVLLAAWPAVRAAQPGATLLVLGDGPLAALLPADDPSVRWTSPDPARRQEQVRAALRAARVVVTPSRTAPDGDAESLLLVNLEAAASGRPVVTTRHGGIPDYVAEGETALLVDEGDPRALAAAIIGVLGDDELARRLGAAGPAFARRHEAATGTARIDEVYDAVLRSRRGRR